MRELFIGFPACSFRDISGGLKPPPVAIATSNQTSPLVGNNQLPCSPLRQSQSPSSKRQAFHEAASSSPQRKVESGVTIHDLRFTIYFIFSAPSQTHHPD